MKQLKLATNYNNKLGCTIFSHIDKAPPSGVPESNLPIPFEIVTADGSYPPTQYKLVSFIRGTLKEFYSDIFTMPSHGMCREDYQKWYLQKNPGTGLFTPMAVYFYALI